MDEAEENVGGGRVYGEYNKGPYKAGAEYNWDEAEENVGDSYWTNRWLNNMDEAEENVGGGRVYGEYNKGPYKAGAEYNWDEQVGISDPRPWKSNIRVTIGTREKKMLVVVVCTANTTKDRTKQVLNTTGMRQKAVGIHHTHHVDMVITNHAKPITIHIAKVANVRNNVLSTRRGIGFEFMDSNVALARLIMVGISARLWDIVKFKPRIIFCSRRMAFVKFTYDISFDIRSAK